MKEEWVDIDGYNGLYQISNLGNVYSVIHKKIRKSYKARDGYKYVQLYAGGKMKHYAIHRLLLISFSGKNGENMQVNHKDENKINNTLSNLEWVTPKENNNYGTRTKRVSEKLKKRILVKTQSGIFYPVKSGKDFSEKIGVTKQAIYQVLSGKNETVKGYRIFHNTLEHLEVNS